MSEPVDISRAAPGARLWATTANMHDMKPGEMIDYAQMRGAFGVVEFNDGEIAVYIATAGGSLAVSLDDASLDRFLQDIRDTRNSIRAAQAGGGSG